MTRHTHTDVVANTNRRPDPHPVGGVWRRRAMSPTLASRPPHRLAACTSPSHSVTTDVWQILESVLILHTCGNLEILFLPLRWRYFLTTIPSCRPIYENVHQRAQSCPVGPLGFKNSCMLILIFFTRLYFSAKTSFKTKIGLRLK